jgi:hypothetical protein
VDGIHRSRQKSPNFYEREPLNFLGHGKNFLKIFAGVPGSQKTVTILNFSKVGLEHESGIESDKLIHLNPSDFVMKT